MLKVNIITPNETGWIMYKFAQHMNDELVNLGVSSKMSHEFDPSCDINHYFTGEAPDLFSKHTTFMITHVMKGVILDGIKKATEKGAVGICMSRQTLDFLVSCGVKRNRICYVNPAQDGQIKPKKVRLGFTHRTYEDNRKRESMLIDICRQISPDIFSFAIMGAGWDSIVAKMKDMGFEVDYYPAFDKERYNQLILSLDYYCYFGFDEGSMGYLDAIAAGIGTIVTPQGYHLDTGCSITYPVSTIDEIVDVLRNIEFEKRKHFRFIETWTWSNYALKHLEIWKYLTRSEELSKILSTRGWYVDGIYSLLLDDLENYKTLNDRIRNTKEKEIKD